MTLNFSGITIAALLLASTLSVNGAEKNVVVTSPDGKTQATFEIGNNINFRVEQDGVEVIAPSQISMTLTDGTVWGVGSMVSKITKFSKNEVIDSPFYKNKTIVDNYNQTSVAFNGGWSLDLRAYNDGVAYRFVSSKSGEYEIQNELAEFNFTSDANATVPYVQSPGDLEHQLFQSFENTYTTQPLSKLDKNRLMFLPLSVETAKNRRVTITEADLRNYPGMYLKSEVGVNGLKGFFAPLRDEVEEHSGYNNLQVIVKSRHDYIAKVDGPRSFPWRVAIVTDSDVKLANSTIVYKLATPNVIGDTSWIKPGKVAWDWWNNWNLEGVDFKAGVNNETYKYFIDFASKNGIEYVILDEGWSVNKVYDLMQVVPEIDIKELVDYGKKRGVGIILWVGYYAFDKDMEAVCEYYSKLGVTGFKVDFMNGDDQELVEFNERVAKTTAKYKMLANLHGTFKPTGLERTYPNIINYEGVHGLEQMKWQPATVDQVTYDVTMPFLRMVAGPIDYTQGAMTNAIKTYNSLADSIEYQYHPSFTKPMSQGTRSRQLAQYIVFFSPLNMLCDTPTAYEKNPISTQYIASIPTVWDESRTIEGKMGEYIVTARRSGDKWYIGALTNWDAREITLDIKEITGRDFEKGTLYRDGINATANGADFVKETINTKGGEVTIKMAPGGGFALIL